jgi:hypothetical protein
MKEVRREQLLRWRRLPAGAGRVMNNGPASLDVDQELADFQNGRSSSSISIGSTGSGSRC